MKRNYNKQKISDYLSLMKIKLTQEELINLIQETVEEINKQPTKILDVPHYLQSDDSTCGPASLRMIFAYYGEFMSEKDIAEICDHTYELGCKSEDMECAAKSLGYDVYLKNNSTIEEVVRLIDANVPVIVDWFCGDPPEGHSSVVIGYNDDNLFILDPYLEEMRVVSKYDFRRCWFDFYETPITPQNLYVGQIIVIRPKAGKKIQQTESEIKERCWKGYTQKGMKTMFGKRYPNCVKKKSVSEDKDETAKYIKCRNCKKKYTQTIYKGKKSLPICPYCGTHENLTERFDPVYYIQNKFSKKPKYDKDEFSEKFESEIQHLVDVTFKFAKRKKELEHLLGFEVIKVTPMAEHWLVLLRPKVDSWWNWKMNDKYKDEIRDYYMHFLDTAKERGLTGGPDHFDIRRDISYHLTLY